MTDNSKSTLYNSCSIFCMVGVGGGGGGGEKLEYFQFLAIDQG